MNMQQTSAIIGILRSIWPKEPVSPETITAWSWAFEDVPYDLVQDAAKRWIRTGTFFPRPGELLKTIGTDAVAPGLIPEAAWTEVQREIRRVGFNRLPTFRDGAFEPPLARTFSSPLIHQAVNAVGWETICTSDKPEVVRAQFLKALEAIRFAAVTRYQTGDVGRNRDAMLAETTLRQLPDGEDRRG